MEVVVGQEKATLAVVAGQPLVEMPADLFIPPDALEVLLDSFSGPLDLLLYLIRRQQLDLLNIPMALITEQYIQYISLMEAKRSELAADYMVMAALLMEIKSRLLLPVLQADEAEEDPRMELVNRLLRYEQYKNAAMQLDALPRLFRDVFLAQVMSEQGVVVKSHPEVSLEKLVHGMRLLLLRNAHLANHAVFREPFSVRERMVLILKRLHALQGVLEWTCFFEEQEGRGGVVVTLLALLELDRQSLVRLIQSQPYAPLYLEGGRDG